MVLVMPFVMLHPLQPRFRETLQVNGYPCPVRKRGMGALEFPLAIDAWSKWQREDAMRIIQMIGSVVKFFALFVQQQEVYHTTL